MSFTEAAYIMNATIENSLLHRKGLKATSDLFIFLKHTDLHPFLRKDDGREQTAQTATNNDNIKPFQASNLYCKEKKRSLVFTPGDRLPMKK
jgi:hypothetical protein